MAKMTPHEIIESNLEYISSRKKDLSKSEVNVQAGILGTLGMMSQSIAKQYILLDNVDEAKKWFTESANYYLQSKEIMDNLEDRRFTPSTALRMLISSILSCNNEIAEKVTNSIITKKVETVGDPLDLVAEEVELYAKIWQGSETKLNTKKYNDLVKKYSKTLSGFLMGTSDIMAGLVDKDKKMLLNGMDIYLQRFPRSGKYKDFKYSMDIPMYLMLARKRGMEIDPEKDLDKKFHKYLPMNLLRDLLKTQ